ncbi:MAG: GNAT family N-acetyltransferase [Cellulosilyticaceae bacterium]
MKTLETQRLILRQWELADAQDLYDYAKNPNVGPDAGWKPHESIDESIEIIKGFIEAGECWAVEEKTTHKVIGSVALMKDSKRNTKRVKMLGYALSQDYWGQGMMVEAAKKVMQYGFEEQKLKLISSGHFAFNTRSKRVLEKCGFKFEGILRCALANYDEGEYDEFCYSITSREYDDL